MPQSQNRRRWRISQADCFAALPKLDADTIDAIVTDPPYGIGVNGMEWDQPSKLDPKREPGKRRSPNTKPLEAFQAFSREWSAACMPTLKPGGHLAAFAAPRTVHRLTCGLEEAGLEVRDLFMWLQGNGHSGGHVLPGGIGTSLKPSWEPIVLARKPLDGTLDHNLAKYGTGAINIDACRIALSEQDCPNEGRSHGRRITANQRGRWPANLLFSHGHACTSEHCEADCPIGLLGDRHRFFYCARAPAESAKQAARSYHDTSCRPSRSACTRNNSARRTPSRTSIQPSSQSS